MRGNSHKFKMILRIRWRLYFRFRPVREIVLLSRKRTCENIRNSESQKIGSVRPRMWVDSKSSQFFLHKQIFFETEVWWILRSMSHRLWAHFLVVWENKSQVQNGYVKSLFMMIIGLWIFDILKILNFRIGQIIRAQNSFKMSFQNVLKQFMVLSESICFLFHV